jgi:hypothetical protein
VLAYADSAWACSDSQTEVYRSAKSVWCVENEIIQKYGEFPKEFFPYGDQIIDELVELFHVPAEGVYTFEAMKESGYAHTGSECCGLGVTVTGDAFYNEGYGSKGYWGYLLSLHELINDWTGQVSGGWPTDFWADHVSAFPNSLDWHIMETLGKKNDDQNLTNASAAQKMRFYPGGDSEDKRVGMFDQIFDLPGVGYDGLSRVFDYVEGDGISWDRLGVPNPDVKRTEYVMAYLSLGAEKSVVPIMQAAHVGDGTDSGAGDAGYHVSQDHVDAIATAHCSIAAAKAQGMDVGSSLDALKSGNYDAVTVKGACGTGCGTECACDKDANLCVAPWLGEAIGGVGDGDSGDGDSGDGDSGDGDSGDGDAGDGDGDDDQPGNGDGDGDQSGDGDGSGDGDSNHDDNDDDNGNGDGNENDDDNGHADPGAGHGGEDSSGCTARAGQSAPLEPWLFAGSLVLGLSVVRARRRRR